MPRGWEDFWGRVRRIQYPTILDARKEPTDYKSYSSYTTVRTFEKDLEFNIKTRWLQLRIVGTLQIHVKVTGADWYARLGYRVFWNDTELVSWTELASLSIYSGWAACFVTTSSGDVKILVDLGSDYYRGKLKVEFGTMVDEPDYHEACISADLNKVEVGVYEW